MHTQEEKSTRERLRVPLRIFFCSIIGVCVAIAMDFFGIPNEEKARVFASLILSVSFVIGFSSFLAGAIILLIGMDKNTTESRIRKKN
jgi:hypothetical protein